MKVLEICEIMELLRQMPNVPKSDSPFDEWRKWEDPVRKLLLDWYQGIVEEEREKRATYHIVELRLGKS